MTDQGLKGIILHTSGDRHRRIAMQDDFFFCPLASGLCPYLFIILKERVLPSANVFTTTFTPFCGAWSRAPSRLNYLLLSHDVDAALEILHIAAGLNTYGVFSFKFFLSEISLKYTLFSISSYSLSCQYSPSGYFATSGRTTVVHSPFLKALRLTLFCQNCIYR